MIGQVSHYHHHQSLIITQGLKISHFNDFFVILTPALSFMRQHYQAWNEMITGSLL